MAARCLVLRCARLWSRNSSFKPAFIRSQSMLSKEREPPNGFLFNEKPLRPGEKRQWEDWEAIWYRWWVIMIVGGGVLFYFKPDTSPNTWARQEALKRLAESSAAGIDEVDEEE
ncbi:predicted protein [Nematostella vectensis]|uniref:NADH dehydrogenase [ubiquinone] 1 beta subcomplex subunit 11, mitochondrial n=1 Tax=Nematostella vectensis TaxID=45351 RepID=A7SJ86_NEMVE|nr:uncharacterized protein LOC5507689 [Nematostella vectensis]EDO36230.1 predicted protein [Nematostella vectensis]|eukprot:XP_001628293.1 predicted protein [Nematostella vectensis]